MIDVLRMLSSQIIGIVVVLVVIWFAVSVLKKYVLVVEYHRPITIAARWLTGVILFVSLVVFIYFASVNCVPRSNPDYNTRNKGTTNFENRVQKQADQEKK